MSRLAGVLAGAVVLLVLAALPAAAHTRASSATNFDSRIEHAPALPGVEWTVYAGGEYVEVVNDSGVPLVVLGYEGEPYLRIGPGGVERNRNSPASYLNLERYGDVAVPPRADPAAAPDWEQVARGTRYAWHDHRVHWMAPSLPPAVAGKPGVRQEVLSWAVPFTHASRPYDLRGTLLWIPGPGWWPWALAALLLTLPAALGARRQPAGALRPAAVVVAAVALVNLAHLPDEFAALPVPALDVAFGLLHNLLFIGAGLAGAVLTWRGRMTSLLPLGIASGAVLFHQGLLQIPQLGASQIATVWPPTVVRMLVALSLAQAVWVTVAIVRSRRAGPPGQAPRGTLVPAERALPAFDNS